MDWQMFSSSPGTGDIAMAGSEVRVYIERLEHKLNSLALASQAMWELLQERTDVSQEELEERMHEIDLRDGVADGKITHTAVACPHCGRKTTRRRSHCMYCNSAITENEDPFSSD